MRDPFRVLVEVWCYPIVVWRGWEDPFLVPESIKARVLMERLIQVYRWASSRGGDDCLDEATDAEALIYLHTASLAQPLDHHWCKIYFHLVGRYFEAKDGLEFLQKYRELDGYEADLLSRLKRWIRSVQRKHVKEKLKDLRPVDLGEKKRPEATEDFEVVGEQARLEDFLGCP